MKEKCPTCEYYNVNGKQSGYCCLRFDELLEEEEISKGSGYHTKLALAKMKVHKKREFFLDRKDFVVPKECPFALEFLLNENN